ncbi:hypothetical protein FIBSPDRAFT_883834 [Athelia psychrophila]|uniref:Uncharacterized protein n=1 Tax=Athelia psychrophila TaxID=1759441 RepID=A0A166TK03_9AGAM|nr:hypothetical protein FIBSPDRAFT_883834 [Fibularhizoctonia sp. CBS 109695]
MASDGQANECCGQSTGEPEEDVVRADDRVPEFNWVSAVIFICPDILSLTLSDVHPGATFALTSSLEAQPTVWVLLMRYVFMPVISMGAVWGTAGRGWYNSTDPCACPRLPVYSSCFRSRAGITLMFVPPTGSLMAFMCSMVMTVVQGV